MLEYVLPLLCLSALLTVCYMIERSFITPVVVLNVMWVLLFFLHFIVTKLNLLPLTPISFYTASVVIFSIFSFVVGYYFSLFIANRFSWAAEICEKERKYNANLKFDYFFLFYSIFVLLLMFKKAVLIIGLSQVESQLIALRNELNYGGESWGYIAYLSTSVMILAICMKARDVLFSDQLNTSAWITNFIVVVAFVCAVLSTGRTSVLLLLISIYFLDTIAKGSSLSFKKTTALFLLTIVFFSTIAVLLNKGGDSNQSISENVESVSTIIAYYFLTPLSALDVFLNSNHSLHYGGYTLRFFFVLANSLGFSNFEVVELIQNFVYVPVPTNVYTLYHAYLSDFGIGYLILMQFFLGLFYGVIFAIKRDTISSIVYRSLLFYPIIMSFYNEQLLTITSQWIQMFTFVALFSLMLRTKRAHAK